MKIGVTQVILPGLKLDEILDLCREAGYQALELVFGEGGEPEVGMTPTEVKAVGKRCRDAGVEIGSVIAHYADRGNLLSRNPEDREQGKRSLARSLEIAEILGVNATLLHPGQLTPEGTYEQAWDDLKGILKEMAGEAEKKRVAICLEQDPPQPEGDARIPARSGKRSSRRLSRHREHDGLRISGALDPESGGTNQEGPFQGLRSPETPICKPDGR